MTDPQDGPRAAPPNFTDHVFKTIHRLNLSIRIWPALSPPPSGVRAPWLLWTHGGSYLVGKHYAPLVWLESGFRARGFHVISHSYRLSPQARIDESLTDCLDAVKWCRENLENVLGPESVDIDRFVICGDSSGGTLATLMGHHLDPPPKVVIDVYGLVDFEAMGWLREETQKSPVSEWKGEFTEAELEAFLGDRNPANALDVAPPWISRYTADQLSKAWCTDFCITKRIRLQAELHVWRTNRGRQGIKHDLLKAVIHGEDFADRNSLLEFIDSVSPLRLLEKTNSYPPTAFLHGTADMVIPVEQSEEMSKKLKVIGVPVVECYEPGVGHGFDSRYTVSLTDSCVAMF
jgi:acetyl esterase/lipase